MWGLFQITEIKDLKAKIMCKNTVTTVSQIH